MMFGFVTERIGWRWINWIQMIMAGVTACVVILYFRETRGNVILSKRAAKLRKETGDDRYQCRADKERASLAILIKTGVSRPLWFLISEPIGTASVGHMQYQRLTAIYSAKLVRLGRFRLGSESPHSSRDAQILTTQQTMYGLVQSITLVYRNIYGWSLGVSGLAFIAIFLGAILGWALNFVQERAYQHYCEHYDCLSGPSLRL